MLTRSEVTGKVREWLEAALLGAFERGLARRIRATFTVQAGAFHVVKLHHDDPVDTLNDGMETGEATQAARYYARMALRDIDFKFDDALRPTWFGELVLEVAVTSAGGCEMRCGSAKTLKCG